MTDQLDQLLSAQEAMDILGVGKTTFYDYLSSGRLKGYRLGPELIGKDNKTRTRWRIKTSDLNAFIAKELHKPTKRSCK